MADFRSISKLISLPVVNLDEISAPRDGLLVAAPFDCAKYFASGEECRKHYERLANDGAAGQIVQCPFGFASSIVCRKNVRVALTGIIPYPRLGGDKERRAAKRFPGVKISRDQIDKAAEAVQLAIDYADQIQLDTIRRQSVALHEIRKLNRTVKQTAERLCSDANPAQPDAADPRCVQIWKSAELMSRQFDVIELLANEDLATLPLKSVSEVYRIFDKCVRIYSQVGHANRFTLNSDFGYSGKILACDKTLSIVPSALIENALKYSLPDTTIFIDIKSVQGFCVVRVTNQAKASDKVSIKALEKGVRLSSDHDGSGHGLHLVKIVVEQHGGNIDVKVRSLRKDVDEVTFIVSFPEYVEPKVQSVPLVKNNLAPRRSFR